MLAAASLIIGAAPKVDSAAAALATPTVAQADDEKPKATDSVQERIFSGPQPGEEITPFTVLRVKADQPKELEIVQETDEPTTLIYFVHRLSGDDRILFGLGLVDFYASRQKELTSHFVLLSDDRAKMLSMLRGWARGSLFTKSLVSVSVDGAEGPGDYGLNRNVAMTVLVAKGNKVVNNLVFEDPNRRDLQTIMAAVAKALGKAEPTLAKVQQELRAERQRRLEKRITSSRVFKLAPNDKLGRSMFGMVNARGNRSQNAKRRSQQLLDWAGDSRERQSALKKYCKAVLTGDFNLNQYSLTAIQNLAGSQEDKDEKDRILSGPQPGEKLTPFKVLEVINSEQVKEVEVVKPGDKGTTLICFMHKLTEPAIGLMMHVEYWAAKQTGVRGHYVMLTGDRAKSETQARGWARRPFFTKSPLSISLDGPEGPGEYGLNRNATMTVLLAKDNKVIKSFAFEDPSGRDSEPVLAALGKTLGKTAPKFTEIRESIRAERRARQEKELAKSPIVKLAPNTDVGLIMLRMIQTEGNKSENAKRRTKELLAWAGDNTERQAALKKYCKAILAGEFVRDDYAQSAIQKLAGD